MLSSISYVDLPPALPPQLGMPRPFLLKPGYDQWGLADVIMLRTLRWGDDPGTSGQIQYHHKGSRRGSRKITVSVGMAEAGTGVCRAHEKRTQVATRSFKRLPPAALANRILIW